MVSDILEEVGKILHEVIGVEPHRIVADANLREDLEMDSLFGLEVMMRIEERFGVEIDGPEVDKLITVADIVKTIEQRSALVSDV